jgi:NitT/TauT family transport system ATP-binding protein
VSALEVNVRSKRYGGGPPVLEDLHFAVPAGGIVALSGPSGVGKTTLLDLLAGLSAEYDGEIGLGGRPLTAADMRLGMVFQEPRLMPWLSVRQNIALVVPDARAEAGWIDELLAAVGLAERADAWPRALSGGMQRRVALARAFAVRPQLLLLDEPFISLDAPTAQQLRNLLLGLWQRLRPTVVLASHDLEDAIALADRILFLSASPAQVLIDQPLPAPRAPAQQQARRSLTARLLEQHPDLLSGRLGAPAPARGAGSREGCL